MIRGAELRNSGVASRRLGSRFLSWVRNGDDLFVFLPENVHPLSVSGGCHSSASEDGGFLSQGRESCHLATSCGNCRVCNTSKPQKLHNDTVACSFRSCKAILKWYAGSGGTLVYINTGYWPRTVKFQMHYGCGQMLNGKSRLVHSACVAVLTSVCWEECGSICSYCFGKAIRPVHLRKFKVAGLWWLGVVWILDECKRWPDKICQGFIYTSHLNPDDFRPHCSCYAPQVSGMLQGGTIVSTCSCFRLTKQEAVAIIVIIIESLSINDWLLTAYMLAKRKEGLSNHESFLLHTIFS